MQIDHHAIYPASENSFPRSANYPCTFITKSCKHLDREASRSHFWHSEAVSYLPKSLFDARRHFLTSWHHFCPYYLKNHPQNSIFDDNDYHHRPTTATLAPLSSWPPAATSAAISAVTGLALIPAWISSASAQVSALACPKTTTASATDQPVHISSKKLT